MTSHSPARMAFLVAVAMTSILQIRPLLFTGLEESIHRMLPEELMEAPILNRNPISVGVVNEHFRNKTIDVSKGNTTVFINTASNQSDLSTTTNTTRPQNITTLGPIFYNAFVPNRRSRATMKIIKEQIQQRNKTDPEAPILYTLIGSSAVDDTIQNVCQPNCTKRDYLEEGNEIDTLQALWEHCQDNPSEIVTYIHDKGSFHPSGANKKARQIGTKSALECRRLMLEHAMDDNNDNLPLPVNQTTNSTSTKKKAKSQCSICSYRFYTLPVFHVRANMWTAKCSYIRNLVAPRDYEEIATNMHLETFNHSILGPTKYACMQPVSYSDRMLGLGRYAMERWLVNHPDVEPCDVLSKHEILRQKKEKVDVVNFQPELTPAPQKRAKSSGMSAYKSSWERLPGRLFEWMYLYQKKPAKSSWVWNYYKKYREGDKEFLNSCKARQKSAIHNMTMLNVTFDGKPIAELQG